MATITFDTHKFISTLIEAGFEAKQAEAVSEAFKVAQSDTDVATKRDLRELELRLDSRFLELENKLVKWGIGLALGQVAVIAALVKIL
ncbi:MAG: DUF1640 domain-containing protein [Methylobacter sp.]|nr:DUF1640 domain-containing protein [Methylobacter sp.]MDZ4221118.1 DUF1640 domain-containing protein [Methylobacter sp.]